MRGTRRWKWGVKEHQWVWLDVGGEGARGRGGAADDWEAAGWGPGGWCCRSLSHRIPEKQVWGRGDRLGLSILSLAVKYWAGGWVFGSGVQWWRDLGWRQTRGSHGQQLNPQGWMKQPRGKRERWGGIHWHLKRGLQRKEEKPMKSPEKEWAEG